MHDSRPLVGVVGAGTMGAGIAQLAAQAGCQTLLHDPQPEALARGVAGIERILARQVQKSRLTPEQAEAILTRLEPKDRLDDLAQCTIIVEATPERLPIKLDIFGRLAGIVATDCVLATNTSSLSVTEIAAGTPHPNRVVGLHFFNPAPVMRLVEVVAGEQTDEQTLKAARALGRAMDRHVIDAEDVAGFLVNRVNRPYSLESLRLLQERVADPAQIDRIARTAGGFRMGPFELMDLIGIETNHAVAERFLRATYGEPRYRPSPLTARKVAAGTLGRKTGRGWYDYAVEPYRPEDPPAPPVGGGTSRVLVIAGTLPVADELRALATAAGFVVSGDAADAWLTLDFSGVRGGDPAPGPRVRHLHCGSLHALEPRAAGFHLVPPLDTSSSVEVTSTPLSDPVAVTRLGEFLTAIGMNPAPVADAPGLVLGRIVCQLINEAAFLIGEGNGSAADVDAGMRLGVNHPRGPIEWSRVLGLDHVTGVLSALHRESGEERYRLAPRLRACALAAQDLGCP